jgi:hypothetical protein
MGMLLPMKVSMLAFSLVSVLALGGARADVRPPSAQPPAKDKPAAKPGKSAAPAPSQEGPRDPAALARRDPAIEAQLKQARGGQDQAPGADETVTTIELGGQCGFAGCSSSSLVAFTFRTRGANTATRTVLALVSCGPVPKTPCTVAPAEVRPTSGPQQAPTPSAPSK